MYIHSIQLYNDFMDQKCPFFKLFEIYYRMIFSQNLYLSLPQNIFQYIPIVLLSITFFNHCRIIYSNYIYLISIFFIDSITIFS